MTVVGSTDESRVGIGFTLFLTAILVTKGSLSHWSQFKDSNSLRHNVHWAVTLNFQRSLGRGTDPHRPNQRWTIPWPNDAIIGGRLSEVPKLLGI
jgi:hypothetical protein